MRLKQYQVDAFATCVFEGNPAAVCPLDHWLDDKNNNCNNWGQTPIILWVGYYAVSARMLAYLGYEHATRYHLRKKVAYE